MNEGKGEEVRTMALLMAHDLRNLFSVLNGLVILLERRPEPRYLEMMKKQLDFCEQIVSSFTRFAEEGRILRRTIPVEPLIQNLVDSFQMPGQVQIEVDRELPGSILGDPGQVRQILWNLLANAVDASGAEKSQIQIHVHSESGNICIEVHDSGAGIAPEIRDRLMEQRVSTKPSGLGLGLYLSRQLAEANGGRLEFDSPAGGGARFFLWLPSSNLSGPS